MKNPFLVCLLLTVFLCNLFADEAITLSGETNSQSGLVEQLKDYGITYWKIVEGFLREYPWLLFCAIVILPGLFFPVSPFFILSGTVFGGGEDLRVACFFACVALSLNIAWTYWLARSPCRKVVQWLFDKRNWKLPSVDEGSGEIFIIFFIRFCGLPLVFQNYVLGLMGLRFIPYMITSLLIQIPTCCAFVYLGDGIFNGKLKTVFIAIASIMFISIIFSFISKRLKNKNESGTAAA